MRTEASSAVKLKKKMEFALQTSSPEASKKEFKPTKFPQRIEVVSGLVEFTLIFALCASFSGALFNEESGLQTYVSLSMQSHLLTAAVSGYMQSRFSDLELSLAAPDIVPTLVLSNLISHAFRFIRPSIANGMALIALCTILTGLGAILVGRIGLSSKATNKMPDFLFNGFVVIAGLLIFSKGVKMSLPKPIYDIGLFDYANAGPFLMFSLCGLPHGVAMFLHKRYNFGQADVVLPLVLFSPLFLFALASVIIGGKNAAEIARENGWLFEQRAASLFYEPITSMYFGNVEWFGVLTAVPLLLILSSAFLVADIFFKSLGTIKMLNPKSSIDKEMMLQGWINVTCGLLCGVPSYSQMKLASINASIVSKTSTTRMPSLLSSIGLGIIFLSAFPLVAYVPRFWLSGILYNVAINFVVDGFYDQQMTTRQRMVILFMVMLFSLRSFLDPFVLASSSNSEE